jgi:hypothetical protein
MATTYAELQTEVADYLSRSDLTAQIKTFITRAEIRLSRELRIRQMLTIMSTPTVAGTATIAIPANYNMMREMHIDQSPVGSLEYKSPSAFFLNTRSKDAGQPRQYTILADTFLFAPIPDAAYTINMLYYAVPAQLSDTNTTNAFLVNCPDLLLYAALAEAEPYLMNDARIAIWAQLYQNGIKALSISDDEGEYSGAPLTVSVSPR